MKPFVDDGAWNDRSIYCSAAKLHICVWFIRHFICLHEVGGNYWRQDYSNLNHFLPPICCTHCMSMMKYSDLQIKCTITIHSFAMCIPNKTEMLFHNLATCNLIGWHWCIIYGINLQTGSKMVTALGWIMYWYRPIKCLFLMLSLLSSLF